MLCTDSFFHVPVCPMRGLGVNSGYVRERWEPPPTLLPPSLPQNTKQQLKCGYVARVFFPSINAAGVPYDIYARLQIIPSSYIRSSPLQNLSCRPRYTAVAAFLTEKRAAGAIITRHSPHSCITSSFSPGEKFSLLGIFRVSKSKASPSAPASYVSRPPRGTRWW